MPEGVEALDEYLGLNGPEPARMICTEVGFGRGMGCTIAFAGRHIAYSEALGHMRRESDRDMLRRYVWQRFWRYLGAA